LLNSPRNITPLKTNFSLLIHSRSSL
jgi:hypothetical protein